MPRSWWYLDATMWMYQAGLFSMAVPLAIAPAIPLLCVPRSPPTSSESCAPSDPLRRPPSLALLPPPPPASPSLAASPARSPSTPRSLPPLLHARPCSNFYLFSLAMLVIPVMILFSMSLKVWRLNLWLSSDPPRTPSKPAVYYALEDVGAVDFKHGKEWRKRCQARCVSRSLSLARSSA